MALLIEVPLEKAHPNQIVKIKETLPEEKQVIDTTTAHTECSIDAASLWGRADPVQRLAGLRDAAALQCNQRSIAGETP
ncbi:hypothetical protein MUK42_10147 [Musa troglodytarum]|uniref:Uncharacterized protein n=1 Tax=Musa troglodytarum TaxID=320322 RepID=A0A9E7EXU6_9LILI|nr:hypothetical protein MUK42_10147 [Musa troglodytarum]